MKCLLILCCCLLLCACGQSIESDSVTESIEAPSSPGTSAPVVGSPAENRVVHETETEYMSLVLPDDWSFEKKELCAVPTADDPDGKGYHETMIAFWPTAEPDCVASLTVHPAPIGICGTGVTFEERTFACAGAGTVAYEDMGELRWYMIFFEAGEGRYDVQWSPTIVQRETYSDAFWEILDTIQIGA